MGSVHIEISPGSARWHIGIVAFGVLLLTVGAWNCAGSEESSLSREPAIYAMRGIVRQIEESKGKTILYIHHEAVDEFVDIEGRTVGMKPMTMPFAVDATATASSVGVGDRVAFDLEVDWQGTEPAVIRSLRILPPGTELDFD